DSGYRRAAMRRGPPGGAYPALATHLAERASRGHGTLTVVPSAGSIENVERLTSGQTDCTEKFAFIQDGTPVASNSGLELLGRLPNTAPIVLRDTQGNAFQ